MTASDTAQCRELATIMSDVTLSPRARIVALAAHPAQLPSIAHVARVFHHFAPGQYAREAHIPSHPHGDDRESLFIGKIHRHAHTNVVSRGRCSVFTEGEGLVTITAPCTPISTPGTKRVVLIHEDLVWTTVHNNPSNTRDLAQLEREIIAPDYEALEQQA